MQNSYIFSDFCKQTVLIGCEERPVMFFKSIRHKFYGVTFLFYVLRFNGLLITCHRKAVFERY